MKVTKGQRVTVKGNEIFQAMGFSEITGVVITVYPAGHGFAIKADQTGAIETVHYGDGQITTTNEMKGNSHE